MLTKRNVVLAAWLIFPAGFLHAETHTLSVGYAQGELQHAHNLTGANLKYRYEWPDSRWSAIASVSTLHGHATPASNSRYTTLAAGPVYRLNSAFSLYGLAGAGLTKSTQPATEIDSGSRHHLTLNGGAGVQFNPSASWVVDVSYEAARFDIVGLKSTLNTLVIGVGYRF